MSKRDRAEWPARRSGPTGRRILGPHLFTAAVLLLALLRATAAAAPTVLDIPVFAGGYGIAFYEETAREFEKLRAADDVRIKLYGDPRIHDKISVRVIGGDLPDAASAAYVPWPHLIRAGKVIDLAPYLDGPNWEGDARWGDSFYPGSLDAWKVDGRTAGVPFTYACWSIFYNRTLFRQHGWAEPRTWPEFFALCERIQATGIAPLALPGTRGLYPDAFFRAAYYNLVGSIGWDALNDLAPGARTSEPFVRAAAVLQRVTRNYTLAGWEGASHTGAQLAFLEGRAAMTVSGSWMLNEMEGKIPAELDIGVMNFPVFPDGLADPTTIQTGADCFFVFAQGDPRRERLTIDFLRFLTSRSRAEAFVRRVNSPVAVRGVPAAAYSPRIRETIALIDRAREAFNMPPLMMQPPALLQVQTDARYQLMTGQLTPEQYGARLEAAAEQDRRRQLEPNRVDYRHPVAGTLLLAGIAGAAGWLWVARRPRRPSAGQPAARRGRSAPTAEFFGRLRPSVAGVFVGPSLLLYLGVVVLPSVAALGWAFTRWNGLGPQTWAGSYNFRALLFENDTIWSALRNNAFLVVVPALVVIPLALLFAALIHRGVAGGKLFRAIFLFPNMLGGIAATLLWLNAYEPHGGLINASLVALGDLLHNEWLRSFAGYAWLTPERLYGSLVPIYLWMACGFNLILYLAAMEGIDHQLYEAAELEGASRFRQFFSITLPLIWDVIAISAVFLVIAGLNAFEMIWLLTAQEPTTGTHTLSTLLVTTMFKYFDIGGATAIAVLLLALVLLLSAILLRVMKRDATES